MKDIYKLLNDVQLDENEFVELEVSDIEKAQMKKQLKQRITKKKKRGNWWGQFAVASLLIGLSGTILGFTFPAQAGSIPIVRDIFKFIDGDRAAFYENYKEFSTAIGLSDESKGIEITMNDAIYDGETMTVTMAIKSKKTLGDQPIFRHTASFKDVDGGTFGLQIKKVDDFNYVGILTAGSFGQASKDMVNFIWKVDKIFIEETNKVINGNWRFAFSIDATEQHTQVVNQSIEQDGVKVTVKQITKTPMSVIVYVKEQIEQQVSEEWDSISLQYSMKDDVGNVYEGESLGGYGEPDDPGVMNTGKTFEKLDERATTLTIVPQLRMLKASANPSEKTESVNALGESVISNATTEVADYKEMTLEPIVIELEK
ncbi:hypothetical protein AEA09_12210 [Lysinibacillus contaminans]|uniref:ECF-type sigma factor negative effector n=1 Tax=Lysinibacillus contaminans TaxID=1293441 RepID=A0ABR5K4G0_9BACI|nr:DUF4179 domain-containing protein [Lysinibacillus contaminans]KOS69239.1 hypothetical protein AEA09_12210 [Lysinibacillus contaminans]